MNSLEIQKWRNKYIYQINESEEDEFDIQDVPKHWNIQDLTIGDTITPEMWGPCPYRTEPSIEYWNYITSKPHKITNLYYDERDKLLYFYIEGSNNDWINKFLKPQYQVVQPNPLNESDDEFNVEDVPGHWNETQLHEGDTITPDMWRDDTSLSDYFIKYPNLIIEIDWNENDWYVVLDGGSGNEYFDLTELNNNLKPNYKVYPPLNESEEGDFDIQNVPGHWNVTELGLGDTITPDMWNDKAPKWFLNTNREIKFLGKDEDDGEEFVGLMEPDDNSSYDESPLETINHMLKPQYKIFYNPEELDESDEFDIQNVPGHWNVTELHEGDTITPNMWISNEPDLGDIIDDPTEDWHIDEIAASGDVWMTTDSGGEVMVDMNDINALLKDEYRIVDENNNLDEGEEDEFNIQDVPRHWNQEHWDNYQYDEDDLDKLCDFAERILKNRGFNESDIENYTQDIAHWGHDGDYYGISEDELVWDFEQWLENQ